VYPEKLSFIIEEEIKTFCHKQKLKKFMTLRQNCKKYERNPTHRRER
jgi:hypothetical protein